MIALYKGKSIWPSRIIEFINWSDYSHASFVHAVTGVCVEAWPGGVQASPNFGTIHTKGTSVDFFRVIGATTEQESEAYCYMLDQVGKKYDYMGVLHFITRKEGNNQKRWFCSELVFKAYQKAGINLLERIHPDKVYPGMLAYSPRLEYVCTKKTKGANLPSGGDYHG